VSAVFGLHVIAYNLICLGKLLKPAMAADTGSPNGVKCLKSGFLGR
jgi:hypothetical protein